MESFGNPESFLHGIIKMWLKVIILLKVSRHSRKLWKPLKVSGQPGNCLDPSESFWTLWKVFRHNGMFPDPLDSLYTLWKISGQSEKFLNTLKCFQKLWDFLDTLESFRIYCLVHFCTLKSAVWKVFVFSVSWAHMVKESFF